MPLQPPVRYAPEVEDIKDDEPDTVAKLNDAFKEILDTTAENAGHAIRSVHAKAHAILEGTLTVEPGLPPELAQGLFSRPGEHRVYMRLSTNSGDILPDAIGLPRGLALKVLDVEGERLPGAEGRTQDFVMNNGKIFPAKNAKLFLQNLRLLAKTTDKGTGAKVVLSKVLHGVESALEAVGLESANVKTMGGAPNTDPLGETYFSVVAFRHGDYIAKYSVAPVSPDLTALTGKEIDADGKPDAIRDTVRAEMPGVRGEWEFRVQLCRDLDKQPVEDASKEWKEEDSPWLKVATIRAEPQDSWQADRVEEVDERLRFSVWTGLAAHRPLGNLNRARDDTYARSAQYRERFNRCPIHEPA